MMTDSKTEQETLLDIIVLVRDTYLDSDFANKIHSIDAIKNELVGKILDINEWILFKQEYDKDRKSLKLNLDIAPYQTHKANFNVRLKWMNDKIKELVINGE